MASDGEDSGRETIRTHKAAAHSLLDLAVLVQNRRKEKGAVLVFGSKVQAVAYPSTTETVLRGAAPLGENLVKFKHER